MTSSLMRFVGKIIALIAAIAILALPVHAQTANVTINATSSLGAIPAIGHGVNTIAPDTILTTASSVSMTEAMGVNALRFPGGSYAEEYHWQNNLLIPGGGAASWHPAQSYDSFIGFAQSVNAAPIITVDYLQDASGNSPGDPNEAAAWVMDAKSKNYNIKYWEIGNEDYGYEGYDHTVPNYKAPSYYNDPSYYGKSVVTYASAMKAQDSTIKIGAVLTNPGSPFDGFGPDWNSNVLAQCGASIDFVILHYYPAGAQTPSDPALLGYAAPQIPLLVARTRALINRYCGANAPNVQIFITETNSVGSGASRQVTNLVNALFVADETQLWLENGVANVDFWCLHSGMSVDYTQTPPQVVVNDPDADLYGNYVYADFGLLSWGVYSGVLPGTDTQVFEPADNTGFPTYYGEVMVGLLGKPGDFMVASATDQPLVSSHAVKNANGNLSVMLVNKDPNSTYTANVAVKGYAASFSTPSTVYFYGENSAQITQASGTGGSSFSQSLPPYSITTVVLTPAPAAPLFTAAVTPSAATVAVSTKTNLGIVVADTGAAFSNGTTVVEVFNSAGAMVAGKKYTGQSWSMGQSKSYAYAWTTPTAAGTYTLTVIATDSTGKVQDYRGNSLAVLQVTSNGSAPPPPAFTMTATALPNPVAPGESVNVTYSYTDTGADLTDAAVWDMAYSVDYTTGQGANLSPFPDYPVGNWVYGQTQNDAYTFTAPSAEGACFFQGSVRAPDGSQIYAPLTVIGQCTVSNSAPTPAFAVTSASASPSTVKHGAVTTITVSLTDNGGGESNGVTGIETHIPSDPAPVWSQQYPGQNWNTGTTHAYSCRWTTPSTPGTYTVYFSMTSWDHSKTYSFLPGPTITVK